jgi:hypothetical protein
MQNKATGSQVSNQRSTKQRNGAAMTWAWLVAAIQPWWTGRPWQCDNTVWRYGANRALAASTTPKNPSEAQTLVTTP